MPYVLLAAFFLATRAWLFGYGLKPEFYYLEGSWQYLDVNLLRGDLWRSLLHLHSQPPLWNALIGVILKVADTPFKVLGLYLAASWVCSILITWMLFFIVRRTTGSMLAGVAAAGWYVALSSSYLYENYLLYPLFTAFLATTCALFTCVIFTSPSARRQAWAFAGLMIALLSLNLTWALFHPLAVMAAGAIALGRLWRKRGGLDADAARRACLAIYLAASALTGVVPLKNHLLFGYFGTSSWVGMNLSGAVPRSLLTGDARAGCEFGPVSDEEARTAAATMPSGAVDHPASGARFKSAGGASNFNHVGYLVRSNRCLAVAEAAIRRDPLAFGRGRLRRLAVSSTMLSDDYFIAPAGLEPRSRLRWLASRRNLLYVPVFSTETRRFLEPYERGSRHYVVPAVALAIVLLLPIQLWRGSKRLPAGYAEVLLLSHFLIVWLLLVGHLVNAAEQERFRFTVEPLMALVIANAIPVLLAARRARSAPRRPCP